MTRLNVPLLLTMLLAAGSARGQTTVTYVGAQDGNWSNPANWDPMMVPANSQNNLFNAILPQSRRVTFDLPDPTQIQGFQLAYEGRVTMLPGTSLEILGFSSFGGRLVAEGPNTFFSSASQFASLGDNSRAWVSNGAVAEIAGTSYRFTQDYGSNQTLLSADGAGSLLDLSTWQAVELHFGDKGSSEQYTVAATNGGRIDLRNVQSVRGGLQNEYLRFYTDATGTIDLRSLRTIAETTEFEFGAPVLELPALVSATRSHDDGSIRFEPPLGGTINLPSLTTADGLVIHGDEFVINAPNLYTLRDSNVHITPTRVWNIPEPTDIDESRFYVTGGARVRVAALDYTFTTWPWWSQKLFYAEGTGSLIDASSLTEMNVSMGQNSADVKFDLEARDGGVVDLSNVTHITGSFQRCWTRIIEATGGRVLVDGLASTSGQVSFEPEVSPYTVPALQTASTAHFLVRDFATINLPELTTATRCWFTMGTGGTLNAPQLATINGVTLNISPLSIINTAPLTNIDHSSIIVTGGRAYETVASGYVATEYFGGEKLKAEGAGSLLDASSITDVNASRQETQYFTANLNGTLDISGIETIVGGGRNDYLHVRALNGGRVILASPDILGGRIYFLSDGPGSIIEMGDLRLKRASTDQLDIFRDGELRLAGDLSFVNTSEAEVEMADGRVVMNGGRAPLEAQRLEVGGLDLGIPDDDLDRNFQIGQLVIGQTSAATNVLLVNEHNNGNGGSNGEAEALYLQGFPSQDGLRIRPGSTLHIGDSEVYAVVNNAWVRIRDLFPQGQNCIPFDQGTICLGDPGDCPADFNGDGAVNTQDVLLFLNAWTTGDSSADFNGDGAVNTQDVLAFLNAWSTGC